MGAENEPREESTPSKEGAATPPRDARLRRASATFDNLDPDVRADLARSRAGLELAKRENQKRDELILRLRARNVQVAHIAYGLGMSYDGVVRVIQRHESNAESGKR